MTGKSAPNSDQTIILFACSGSAEIFDQQGIDGILIRRKFAGYANLDGYAISSQASH